MDMKNIATAITRYRDVHGGFPYIDEMIKTKDSPSRDPIIGPVSKLKGALSSSLEVPSDPQKNNLIDFKTNTNRKTRNQFWQVPWEYIYQTFKKWQDPIGAMVLITKVETPDFANFIDHWKMVENCIWGIFYTRWWKRSPSGVLLAWANMRPRYDISCLKLCTSVIKLANNKSDIVINSDNSIDCLYTSKDELYHIVKIE